MIVVCEGCARRFQLDESRIPKTGARVRCKHCHHRFRVSPPGHTPTEAGDSSAAAAPGRISAEDTLFGAGTSGGAPIDGDRSLFGSLDDEPAAATTPTNEASRGATDGESWGGLSQDLRFVREPAGPDDTSCEAVPPPPSEASSESATAPAPDGVTVAPREAPAPSVDEANGATVAREVGPSPSGEDAAAESSGGEDSWEFADSDLSLTEAPDAELAEEAAPAAESSFAESPVAEADAESVMQIDPGASHPEAAAGPGLVDDTPSLRAVGPGAGPDAAVFEMVEGEDEGMALELEGEASAATDVSGGRPGGASGFAAEGPLEAQPPDARETGAVDDGECVAADAEASAPSEEVAGARSEGVEPGVPGDAAPADFGSDEVEDDPDPDGTDTPGDGLPPAAPGATRQRGGWREHAGWALALVLPLAVAQGTVRVEPALHPVPPGEVEIAGLVAENVRGRFVENAHSGTLFVVSGELHNRGVAARASGELRMVVLDEHGFTFEGRDVPIGLALAEARLRETPIGVLQQHHARLARTLAERSLAPGDSVRFQAILADLPENAVRFRLEAAPGQAGEAVGAAHEGAPADAG